jgi:hypothetical protein
VSSPPDATYSIYSSGNVINWSISDNFASGYYRVLLEGTELGGWQTWVDDTNVSISIDTTTLGTWNYTIQYNDSVGLWGAPDTVLITIEDQTNPWASSPSPTTYPQGVPATITWTLYDNVAGGVYGVMKNGSEPVDWTPWSNETPFEVNVDTSLLGVWNYTIQYNDSVGLWGAPDTVLITIEDGIAPWASHPSDATCTQNSTAVISWTLFDNFAGATYQVLLNGTPIGGWLSWTNSISFDVSVNTTTLGVWNYTIQYCDANGLWGVPDTVIITIKEDRRGGIPSFAFFVCLISLAVLALNYYRKKVPLKGNLLFFD